MLLRAFLIAGFLSCPLPVLYAQAAVEADLKAALVYNFVQFTEWVESNPDSAGAPFTICYVGEELSAAFVQVATRTIRDRGIVARPIAAEGPYDGCQVVYWHEVDTLRTRPVRTGPGVLTIGSGPEFISLGGMIEMQLEGTRIVFSINPDSASAAGLRFSSKLLRLAKNLANKVE